MKNLSRRNILSGLLMAPVVLSSTVASATALLETDDEKLDRLIKTGRVENQTFNLTRPVHMDDRYKYPLTMRNCVFNFDGRYTALGFLIDPKSNFSMTNCSVSMNRVGSIGMVLN